MRLRSQIHRPAKTIDHDRREQQDRDQLLVGDRLLGRRRSAAIVTKMKMPPTQATIALIDCFVGFSAADPGIEECRDDQRDRAERLHHDQRRERERAELADDRQARASTVPTPRRAASAGCQQLRAGEPCAAGRPAQPSTLVTPRCWYCAPNDMKTAPSSASGIPMRMAGSWKTPTSVSAHILEAHLAVHITCRH